MQLAELIQSSMTGFMPYPAEPAFYDLINC